MPAPDKIIELCDRFDRNIDTYKQGKYNETQVRKEFIDPFFKILGWDMDNEQGYAEAYKDVVHEDAIKVGGATKAPDYSFRIGGVRKFFLEAKKPSIYIKEDIHPAFQLRRYAWSAKLPLSVLTDFEEFAVYDCRIKPEKNDKAATARILYLTFKDYVTRWDEIAGIFTREAILKGSFDKYVESNKAKKGTAEVDQAFLQEIERWRDLLAKNIALRNPQLIQRDLNFAVQRTIDRIIFLRICEDRGIEPYGTLMALQNGAQVYPRLFQLFYRADERYNSGLFHFEPEKDRSEESLDALTPNLDIDDKVLKDIFKNLYYPDSPYEFYVLPADILGQVYEQFLGKVIRLTAGHRAVVETRPEVRKAGGVYYTPTYIVDYIVKQTVGRLLEDKMPGPKGTASKLRILDPACGSGSFLLGAYQFLLNWHRDAYLKDNPEAWAKKKNPPLRQNASGEWVLTTDERKRILLNNIYGVDIDPQAVEVTKLSLLLKVLEGADANTLEQQMKFFHERALPDLSQNIKCGNSLIGPDFYDGQQLGLLDDEEMHRINAFDWKKEFSEVFENGGFDAVIGNPPWGAEFSENELKYLRNKNQEIIIRMIDSFMYFTYQSLHKLKHYWGMILPDVILYQKDNEKLRKHILHNYSILCLLNMGNVFEKVTRPSSILILKKENDRKADIKISDFSFYHKNEKSNLLKEMLIFETLSQEFLSKLPSMLFITSKPARYNILTKLNQLSNLKLEQICDIDGIQRGVSPDLKEAFIIEHSLIENYCLETEKLRKVLTGGKHVKRYFIDYPELWLIYTQRNENFKKFPNICSYINQFKDRITCKEVKTNKHSLFALHRAREEKIFLKPKKLLGVITEDKIVIALDENLTFVTDGLYLFGIRDSFNDMYVLGILNSKLFVFIYRLLSLEQGRVLAQVKPTILNELPIRNIDFTNSIDKLRHNQMVQLVERMLDLHKQLAAAQNPQTRTVLQRQIEATDRQIDQLVYALYELTAEEIGIVEGER